MADERIKLEYDPSDAIAAANKINKSIEANEKTAEKAGAAIVGATEKQATSIVSITERSQTSINRIVAAAERKAAIAGSGGLQFDKQQALGRVAGDPAAINRITAAYDKMAVAQNKAGDSGSKLAEIIRNPLQSAGAAFEDLSASMGKVGLIASATVAGIALLAKAGFDLVASQGKAAEAVTNFADTVGISATEAYKLKIQAELTGGSLESLVAGYKKLSQGIQEGSEEGKKSSEALGKLGVRIFDLNGGVRDFGGLFGDIARKINGIAEPTARATKLVEIFGKSGLSLTPLILDFDGTRAAAERAAAGIDDPLLRKLSETDDKIGELMAKWESLKSALAVKIVAVVEFVQSVNKGPLDFIDPGSGALRESGAAMRNKLLADTTQGIQAAQGAALIAQFKAQRSETDATLKQRLSEVTAQRQAAEQFGFGLGPEAVSKRIEEVKKLTAEEVSLTTQIKNRAKAEADANKERDAREKALEKARQILAQRAAGGFRVEVIKDLEAKPVNELYERQFKKAQEVSGKTIEMELGNLRERLAQEEIFADAARDNETNKLAGFHAITVEQKIAVETQKAEIEKQYVLKSFALKAALLEADQDLELAKAEQTAEMRAAINEKYALAGRELTLKTEAAIEAAGAGAVINSQRIIQDANQKSFDSIKNAADGLFDTLVLRTKSWGDLLKNTVLLPALTLVKQLVSTAIAGALTGRSGGGNGGGLGGLLGGLLGGAGISRAGAPGGTGGFAGPVGGISGMLGTGGGGGSKLAGFGGAGGLGLAAAALGGFGAFKAGQADNKALKYSAPAIGAVAGLVGFGSLASLFPALIAAGPAGWIAAAGIGATIGLIGIFKKKAEDKIIEKIKSVYGITVDRSFAKNPLAGIIKDQFGGNIDAGIRSPMIREMLAVYRMQSNQAGAGSGLSPYNDAARGVSLSGYGGGVFQNPVSVNGGSYGYGGALPSTGPSQPFQQPIVIENRLQIDGRDVQASVLRTNQGSTGRRELAAVLSDPLLVFG